MIKEILNESNSGKIAKIKDRQKKLKEAGKQFAGSTTGKNVLKYLEEDYSDLFDNKISLSIFLTEFISIISEDYLKSNKL